MIYIAEVFWHRVVLGDVLVLLDLRHDESLYEAGAAREVKMITLCMLY